MECLETLDLTKKDYSPEEKLWLAVLEQACWDAQEAVRFSKMRKKGYKARARELRDSVQVDLSDEWFDEVCQSAGLDPGGVRKLIYSILTSFKD